MHGVFFVRIDTLTGGVVLTALLLASAPAAAQNNPFVPPQGGISKAQVQAIIRAELAREAQAGGPGAPAGPGGPGAPAGGVAGQMKGGPAGPAGPGGSRAAAAINGLTAAQGSPNGVSTASKDGKGGVGGDSDDPVGQLITGGGQFVGCVSATPVFKDKDGRRAYFTSKELKASNEAKRIARCG